MKLLIILCCLLYLSFGCTYFCANCNSDCHGGKCPGGFYCDGPNGDCSCMGSYTELSEIYDLKPVPSDETTCRYFGNQSKIVDPKTEIICEHPAVLSNKNCGESCCNKDCLDDYHRRWYSCNICCTVGQSAKCYCDYQWADKSRWPSCTCN